MIETLKVKHSKNGTVLGLMCQDFDNCPEHMQVGNLLIILVWTMTYIFLKVYTKPKKTDEKWSQICNDPNYQACFLFFIVYGKIYSMVQNII